MGYEKMTVNIFYLHCISYDITLLLDVPRVH